MDKGEIARSVEASARASNNLVGERYGAGEMTVDTAKRFSAINNQLFAAAWALRQ